MTRLQRASARPRNPTLALTLGLAIALGALVRLAPVLSADFPLNDGGLFYAMTRDLQRAGYALPATTSYNAAGLPFAYPPLAFYLAGGLADLSDWNLLDLYRILPALLSTLSLVAFFPLARALLPSRRQALLALYAFALLPWSFLQGIKGGGLTRSIGLLLALLTLHQAHRLYHSGRWRYVVTTGLLAGLTVLSHPEMALFTCYSVGLILLFYGRNRAGLLRSLAALALAAIASAPWWATVVGRHGLDPLLAATQSGTHPWGSAFTSLLAFNFTGEPFSSLLAILGLLGLLAALARGAWLLPTWLVAIFLLSPRGESTQAMLPLAMLIALGIDWVVLPALRRPVSDREAPRPTGGSRWLPDGWTDRLLPLAALGFFLLHGLLSAWGISRPALGYVHPLPREERAAMAWAAENTPPESTFLVVTAESWWKDPASEWFPVLAERISLATTQGYEWSTDPPFDRRLERYNHLQSCAGEGTACLERWVTSEGASFDYLYLPHNCCAPLRAALQTDPLYLALHQGRGATIWAPTPEP